MKKIFADGGAIAYIYDQYGRLSERINARGIRTRYIYDNYHNISIIDYSDATPDVTFSYDDYNRLAQTQDGIGLSNYTFDANSRFVSLDGPWKNDGLSYQYDSLGRLNSVTPQLGQPLSYKYDLLTRLTTIQAGDNSFTYNYTSDASPLVQTLTSNNGSVTTQQYDQINRLTSVINKTSADVLINQFDYTYNDQDFRGSETITNGQPMSDLLEGVTAYQHNDTNQLVSTTDPNQLFEYDADGNMIKGYTPDGYQYTAAYDAENRLASISYMDGSGAFQKTEFEYNYQSFLSVIRLYQNGTLIDEIRIVRNGFLALQERNSNTQIIREYVWGKNMGRGIGGLLAMAQGGQVYSYLYDGKGNVSSVLDASQQVVASYRYDSFGRLTGQTGSLNQPYQFSTKRYFSDTGLNYYGYRFYAPAIGRWINRDPIGETGGINLYGFVQNNPITNYDQLGLTSCKGAVMNAVWTCTLAAGSCALVESGIGGVICVLEVATCEVTIFNAMQACGCDGQIYP